MFHYKYLSDEHLKGFERYKYNSVDTSLLSVHVMHPFWNWCVKYFPRWLAPNLITFTGFLLTVATFFLIGNYDYGFTAADQEENPIPRWVWLAAAFGIFLAYNLDGIDGKQARRTGTSGPLGELFDHGLDSYSAALIPIYMFTLFGVTDLPPIRMFYVISYVIFLNFYLTHFEKYNTGVMFLPWGYDFTMWVRPAIAQVSLTIYSVSSSSQGVTIVLSVTFCVGPWLWRAPTFFGLTPADSFLVLLVLSAVLSSHPVILWNIYKSYRDRTGKMRPFLEAIRPLMPLVGLYAVSHYWMVLSINDVVTLDPRMLFVCFGTIFSNICCRLIVAQMSDTRTDCWNGLLWVLLVATGVSTFPFYDSLGVHFSVGMELAVVYTITGISTAAHIHYGTCVVREMCHHFNIKCFQIPPSEAPLADA
ncbi:ethanolaminephosphotransferase 1 isoform X2 [Phlebotomus argentipes]|uniref:ethanolaminephosphotransferase 1 isoform X2 n=1 Tax=Phlebotomus argentipes TaxID=94469 RepID=UPI002892A946|nr:ethanolaminephosphotransferase 1 isoform X2 [Phlebotomus argentipes]